MKQIPPRPNIQGQVITSATKEMPRVPGECLQVMAAGPEGAACFTDSPAACIPEASGHRSPTPLSPLGTRPVHAAPGAPGPAWRACMEQGPWAPRRRPGQPLLHASALVARLQPSLLPSTPNSARTRGPVSSHMSSLDKWGEPRKQKGTSGRWNNVRPGVRFQVQPPLRRGSLARPAPCLHPRLPFSEMGSHVCP